MYLNFTYVEKLDIPDIPIPKRRLSEGRESKLKDMPTVIIDEDTISMSGNCFMEGTKGYFRKLTETVAELKLEHINLIVKLNYINSSSNKLLAMFFSHIVETIPSITFTWEIEEDDEDMVDFVETLEENLHIPIIQKFVKPIPIKK